MHSSFAQWHYRSLWGSTETRLLLIENLYQYPARRHEIRSTVQFLEVLNWTLIIWYKKKGPKITNNNLWLEYIKNLSWDCSKNINVKQCSIALFQLCTFHAVLIYGSFACVSARVEHGLTCAFRVDFQRCVFSTYVYVRVLRTCKLVHWRVLSTRT